MCSQLINLTYRLYNYYVCDLTFFNYVITICDTLLCDYKVLVALFYLSLLVYVCESEINISAFDENVANFYSRQKCVVEKCRIHWKELHQ